MTENEMVKILSNSKLSLDKKMQKFAENLAKSSVKSKDEGSMLEIARVVYAFDQTQESQSSCMPALQKALYDLDRNDGYGPRFQRKALGKALVAQHNNLNIELNNTIDAVANTGPLAAQIQEQLQSVDSQLQVIGEQKNKQEMEQDSRDLEVLMVRENFKKLNDNMQQTVVNQLVRAPDKLHTFLDNMNQQKEEDEIKLNQKILIKCVAACGKAGVDRASVMPAINSARRLNTLNRAHSSVQERLIHDQEFKPASTSYIERVKIATGFSKQVFEKNNPSKPKI